MSKFRTVALALLMAALMSVAAYGRGGGGGHGGGGHGGGGGFHGGGGGFHGGGGFGGFHGGGFRGGGFGGGFHGGGFRGGGFSGFHGGFGGPRFGGGRMVGPRPVIITRSFGPRGFNGNRSFAMHNAQRFNAPRNAAFNANRMRNANAMRQAFNSRPVNRALHNAGALRNPGTRAFVTAGLATAAWHQGWRGRNNWWWRHRNGGFGWVGPVFWPFAFYDMYNYAFWGAGYDDSFWGYGYPDLYAGIFGLYGYDDLSGYAGYLPQYAGRSEVARDADTTYAPTNSQSSLAQMCGEDSRAIAGLPIDVFQKAIQPDDAQRAALDDLTSATAKAAQILKASCPTDIALTAPRRLAVMQQRIEAMIAAVQTVQPPLEKFYGLLSDEQKAKLNGLTAAQRPAQRQAQATANAASATGPNCAAQPALTEWPSAAIDQRVRPTEEQRKGLDALQNAANKAADMLKASCPPDAAALTPTARLAAMGRRLDTMLQAVKSVRAAMDSFYGSLTDEQKANFDAVGPQLTGAYDQPAGGRRHRGYYR